MCSYYALMQGNMHVAAFATLLLYYMLGVQR